LIGSGGNDPGKPVSSYKLRYYANDGKGKFTKADNYLTTINGNFSCIIAEDFDNDGDEDLFLGRRIVPGNYGLAPGSFLLRNDSNNTWTPLIQETLSTMGMVTDAVWTDINNDSLKDLIVVGEWMPVMIFKNTGKTFELIKPVTGSEGWWTSINTGDFNNDGLNDVVLGNWGLNSRFKASASRPMDMYVKDFDQNGKSEFVITFFPSLDNRAYPFASKSDMTSQLPALKKKVLKYGQYAAMSYEELFTPEQQKDAQHYRVNTLKSSVLINKGNFNFTLQALPIEAQVSPVFAIVANDFNNDNHIDLLLCGNFSGLKHEIARQDANRGVLLTGNGNGEFTYQSPEKSGLFIKGEVRDSKIIRDAKGNKVLLIGRNNETMLVYKPGF
jgi:hypothetical protein